MRIIAQVALALALCGCASPIHEPSPCQAQECFAAQCEPITIEHGDPCSNGGLCDDGECLTPEPPPTPENGGVCTGCNLRGVCVWTPSANACGANGAICKTCAASSCEVAYCLDGGCAVFTAPDNTPCGEDDAGVCTAGVCGF